MLYNAPGHKLRFSTLQKTQHRARTWVFVTVKGILEIISDTLVRIKRAILLGHYAFSEKASLELESDGLTELDIVESIVNAVAIYKTIRSQSPYRKQTKEYLHIIQSTNF